MTFDPHSASLRSAPLPRSTGERKRRPQGLAPFLYPTQWGRGAERSEAERGHFPPYAIALPCQASVACRRRLLVLLPVYGEKVPAGG
jgi:hypothetical protein